MNEMGRQLTLPLLQAHQRLFDLLLSLTRYEILIPLLHPVSHMQFYCFVEGPLTFVEKFASRWNSAVKVTMSASSCVVLPRQERHQVGVTADGSSHG